MAVWGLISDVHGNLPALERAVALCRSRGAERFAFLGDLLGRGDSDACVSIVQSLADVSVVGNRDLDWQHRVSAASRTYVLSLPPTQRADDFVAVHGDGRLNRDLSSDEIRRGFRRAYHRLTRDGARLGVFGHTHRARVWRLPGPDREAELLFDGATNRHPATIALVHGDTYARYVVNVGSTGLPFPGKGPPSCAVYDVEGQAVEMLPVET